MEAPDNIEMAEDGMWNDEGPDDPDDAFPIPRESIVSLVFLATGTTKKMKPYVDLTVDDRFTGERFRVRTVKLFNELKGLANGTKLQIKWFENGPFKNLVSASVLEKAPSRSSGPKTSRLVMKTVAGYELTKHEVSCVRSLKRLAKKWNLHTNRLWLFSASSHLAVLLKEGNGNREPEFNSDGTVNQNNLVVGAGDIGIPNDGGDW